MQAKKSNFPESSVSEAELRQFADSTAGRELLQRLQQQGGVPLAQALEAAGNGNPDAAKKMLHRLLADRRTAALLEQLRHG